MFTYGTLGPSSSASLVLANPSVMTSRQTYSFDYSQSGKIMLDISGAAANLNWAGSNGTVVGHRQISTTSWQDVSNGNPDTFVNGDHVNFTTAKSGSVTLNGSLAPGSINVTGSYTFSGTGSITGGGLTVQSPGLLTIANSGNNYTLGTAIQGGTLVLGTSNALPIAGTITLGTTGSAGTFDLAGFNQTVGGLAVGSGATTANQVITASSGSSTLTYSNSGGSSIFGGTIQDTVGSTGGTLGLTVSSGTLDVRTARRTTTALPRSTAACSSTAALPNGSGVSVGAAGSLGVSGTNLSMAAVSNLGSVAFAGTSGTIALAGLSGTGTTTFAAGASFPTLSAGVVTVAGLASIGTASGGTANFNGATAAIASLGNSIVSLGSNTALTISAGSQTAPGTISGSGSLAMAGPGTLTLASQQQLQRRRDLVGRLAEPQQQQCPRQRHLHHRRRDHRQQCGRCNTGQQSADLERRLSPSTAATT